MANNSPEQDLIDLFVKSLEVHEDKTIKIQELYNKNCKVRNFADIEFTSESGVLWLIEAKSNDSSDNSNTVHKIFGGYQYWTSILRKQPHLLPLLR